MKNFFILLIMFFLAGCDGSETQKPTKTEEARQKAVFWDREKPRIMLDPIEEESRPLPTYIPEEKQ